MVYIVHTNFCKQFPISQIEKNLRVRFTFRENNLPQSVKGFSIKCHECCVEHCYGNINSAVFIQVCQNGRQHYSCKETQKSQRNFKQSLLMLYRIFIYRIILLPFFISSNLDLSLQHVATSHDQMFHCYIISDLLYRHLYQLGVLSFHYL